MKPRKNIQIPDALHERLTRFVERYAARDPLQVATTTRTDVLVRAATLGLDYLEKQFPYVPADTLPAKDDAK